MLKRLVKKLRGYKTHIAAFVTIASTIAGYSAGEIGRGAAVQIGLTALFAALLRDGLKTEVAKTAPDDG